LQIGDLVSVLAEFEELAPVSWFYYDRSRGDLDIDSVELQKKLEQLLPGNGAQDPKALVHELLEATPPRI
jgi:hypothetical protein